MISNIGKEAARYNQLTLIIEDFKHHTKEFANMIEDAGDEYIDASGVFCLKIIDFEWSEPETIIERNCIITVLPSRIADNTVFLSLSGNGIFLMVNVD